jgi:hypothetical protein
MENMLAVIYFIVDTSVQVLERIRLFSSTRLGRKPRLSKSEVIAISTAYHFSGFRCFKAFYCYLLANHNAEFPGLVSYSQFTRLQQEIPEQLYELILSIPKQLTKEFYVDSSKLEVCKIKRKHSHKVMKQYAQLGKSSMGWFFGLKLHLITNSLGEIMNFTITPGGMDDRQVLPELAQNLEGKMFGDRGYQSEKKARILRKQNLFLFVPCRKNMKPKCVPPDIEQGFRRRISIERSFNRLKNVHNIEHSRHRSPRNWFTNVLSGLYAYSLDKIKSPKTDLSFSRLIRQPTVLT